MRTREKEQASCAGIKKIPLIKQQQREETLRGRVQTDGGKLMNENNRRGGRGVCYGHSRRRTRGMEIYQLHPAIAMNLTRCGEDVPCQTRTARHVSSFVHQPQLRVLYRLQRHAQINYDRCVRYYRAISPPPFPVKQSQNA